MVVVAGILTRERGERRLRDWTEKQAMPTVAVAKPGTRQLSPTLNLPGRLEAFSRAPIFARVSGYLKEWKVDIGMPVKAGQLLAEIDAPDLDQQLLQVAGRSPQHAIHRAALGSYPQAPPDARRRRA